MGSIIISNLILLLSIGSLFVTAIPLETARDIKVSTSSRSTICQEDAISNCVSDTGLDGPSCFAKVCALEVDLKVMKRQDTCTEENLVQCAVTEWREAEVCFQELCL
ncbi:hypothetical protein MGN70_008315 [Eutypa lata]|nr:hypothetical protein MGN70_008315 [Eutypa lata]